MNKSNFKSLLFMAFAVVLFAVAGCSNGVDSTDVQWRCSVLNCSNQVELSGVEWANQNCEVTEQGTLCNVVLDNGQQGIVPLDQINVSAIKATQCLEYTCLEETPFREVNYIYNISGDNQ